MFRISFVPILLVLAWSSFCANAQTACPAGVAPGSPQCGPDSGTSRGEIASPPPRPTGEWIKTWGAIATSNAGDTGVSSGYVAKEDAEESAISSCENLGQERCKVSFTFFNQCVAAAMSTSGKGTASTAESITKASSYAKERCEDLHGGQCRITLSKCTDPVFRKY
ncbi:DUF4189 domain-containing protein [Xanthomonas campestris]|uniref:DUF4189 domain-containing protein n=1 Tax=Xanthomonas campestris TaxID=339 RepID=UPI002378F54F|nr:DUF4189 domain-containing protein [Xanthomonas campestris]WDK02764.1 DUF4189 domain-containing protein [Xanthomonas campestris]